MGEAGGSPPISRVLSWAAIPLGPPLLTASSSLPGSDASHANAPLFGLAPDEVCHAVRVTTSAVSSYRKPLARFAPSCDGPPFHPYLISPCSFKKDFAALRRQSRGSHRRYLSVALSVASRRPAVSRHPALWGPDFPLDDALSSDCLANFHS